jgi:hypothetical protein
MGISRTEGGTGKVLIVLHSGIENDIYIRGVFVDPDLAERMRTLDEVREWGRRTHSRYCCEIFEEEVLDRLPEIEYGPEIPYGLNRDPIESICFPAEAFPLWQRIQRTPSTGIVHVYPAIDGDG